MTDQMCHKWFVKFHAGDFLLDVVSLVDHYHPIEVDSDQIETLIENNQHYTQLPFCYSITED